MKYTESKSHETDGVGSIPTRCGRMDNQEVGQNRIEAIEMWCWRKILGVSWREHRTNKSILE